MQIGRALVGDSGLESYMFFSLGMTFLNLNLVTKIVHENEYLCLGKFLPRAKFEVPLKGSKVYGAGPLPSNLKGSNFSGSGKYLGVLVRGVYCP